MQDWTITWADGSASKQMRDLSQYELNLVEMHLRTGTATTEDREAALQRVALEHKIRSRTR